MTFNQRPSILFRETRTQEDQKLLIEIYRSVEARIDLEQYESAIGMAEGLTKLRPYCPYVWCQYVIVLIQSNKINEAKMKVMYLKQEFSDDDFPELLLAIIDSVDGNWNFLYSVYNRVMEKENKSLETRICLELAQDILL